MKRVLIIAFACAMLLSLAVCSYAEQAQASELEADAAPKFQFNVKEKDGDPIEGVMLQLCDDSTCQVLLTDSLGYAELEGKVYAYEVHVLKVPAGYAPHTDVYTMPQEGGLLLITLDKA